MPGNCAAPVKTILEFSRAKRESHPIVMLAAYDAQMARIVAGSEADAILVGDSVAMVAHGFPSTVHATLDMMCTHVAAVRRGAAEMVVVADLPFLSVRRGVIAATEAAGALMQAGATAVKLEGVSGHEDVVAHLVESGIPVMGHLGMQPQSVRTYGGFHVQGKAEEAGAEISREAKLLEELGAFSLVLECIPSELAREITESLRIPTIGIGAGAGCDGQILVLHDLLGMNPDFHPKFARHFLEGADSVLGAVDNFDTAVKAGTFPAPEESYS